MAGRFGPAYFLRARPAHFCEASSTFLYAGAARHLSPAQLTSNVLDDIGCALVLVSVGGKRHRKAWDFF